MEATAFLNLAFVVTTKDYPQFCFRLQCVILSTPEAALLTKESKQSIVTCLVNARIWDKLSLDDDNSQGSSWSSKSSKGLLFLARDFVDRPKVFSLLLIKDFGFLVLEAHQTRALVMAAILKEQEGDNNKDDAAIVRTSMYASYDSIHSFCIHNKQIRSQLELDHKLHAYANICVLDSPTTRGASRVKI